MTPPLLVAVQGELGSNSELAAREAFAGRAVDILPCYSFADLFEAILSGKAAAAMAPVENSLAGSVHDVWDLLRQHEVPVSGEIRLRVVHCLIGLPGATIDGLRRVRSHPQALMQCADYLAGLPHVTAEEAYDTAGAVQLIRDGGDPAEGAIASAQAARDTGMQILAEDLSAADNFTRFLVLGNEPVTGSGERRKTTAILELEHTAAALPAAVGLLTGRGVEVLKVETRKRAGRPWAYGVYLEFVGDADAAAPALQEIDAFVSGLRVVGSYPVGSAVEPRLHAR
jgi:prephenate dehydratase